MKLKHFVSAAILLVVLQSHSWAQTPCVTEAGKPVFDVTNANIASHLNWSADTVWRLVEQVFVIPGQTLTIEPGTVIKGQSGTPARSLIITRGAKIDADGTPQCPIVFTMEADNVDIPDDVVPPTLRGQWGSLLILGNAPICFNGGSQNKIEGIDTLLFPTQSLYGGPDIHDSSGVLRYVSLRHGGAIIGAANEINGLTLGGVGDKTVVEHIEVFANLDDGYEWFGGTVNCKYLISAFNDDDNIDYDEGYQGAIQYFFAVQDSTNGDSGGELNGTNNGTAGWAGSNACYSQADVANATFIGRGLGSNAQGPAVNKRVMEGGKVLNSVITEFRSRALQIDTLGNTAFNTYRNTCGGRVDLLCNFWWNFNGNGGVYTNDPSLSVYQTVAPALPGANCGDLKAYFFDPKEKNNVNTNPGLNGVSRTPNGLLDPRATTNLNVSLDSVQTWCDLDPATINPYLQKTNFIGAFDPNQPLWTEGWTHLWQRGYTPASTASLAVPVAVCSCCDLAGDADNDASVTIGDAVYTIAYIFTGGPAPICNAEGDADGDASVTIGDVVYLIAYIFNGGPTPLCGA